MAAATRQNSMTPTSSPDVPVGSTLWVPLANANVDHYPFHPWQWRTTEVLPPYGPQELPGIEAARFRSDMAALHRATNTFMAVVHRYELWRAIARNHEFVARINNTRTAHAMTTISGVLIASLVVSLPAFFDDDRDAVSLGRVLTTLLLPES